MVMINRRDEMFSCKCFNALEKHVRKATSKWGFYEWYTNGIDPFLAKEVLYLTTIFLKREDYDECDRWVYDEIRSHRPEFVGRQAYEFVDYLDDFPRLWKVEEKISVATEFATWLKENTRKIKSSRKGASES